MSTKGIAVARPRPSSALEDMMLFQIRGARLPEPEREWTFAKPRRWRFDFAYPSVLIALECEGGTWAGGRHTRGAGYEADVEKYSEAAVRGWLVIRATRNQIESGQALTWVETLLGRVGATVKIA